MQFIQHKDYPIVNLDQVTHIELDQTATQYKIVFYHHFAYTEENSRGLNENYYESIWYFESNEERDRVYETICSKYVDRF